MIDLLKAYFRIEERDDERDVREKITGNLLTLDRPWNRRSPPFCPYWTSPWTSPLTTRCGGNSILRNAGGGR